VPLPSPFQTYNSNFQQQLASFSAILEKVIYNRLLEHVINNIPAKEQFGFRRNLTTERATYELSNEIIDALDKNLPVGRIFCDLANVFNCVNHGHFAAVIKLVWNNWNGQ
jgi:hypothetical protein